MNILRNEITKGLIFSKAKSGYLSLRIDADYLYSNNEIRNIILQNNIKSAVIDGVFDCLILNDLINIEVLHFSYNENFNCKNLYNLHKIKKIQLDNSYKMSIDFGNFKELEEIDIIWNNNLIFKGADDLRYLILRKYDKETFELELPNNIEFLELIQGKLKSVEGIEKYQSLKALVLYAQPKIENYTKIEELKNLEFLHIHGGHLKDVVPFTKLTKLKWLVLENCKEIETLKPLLDLDNLIGVQLVGNTKPLDGDKSIRDIKNKYEYYYSYKSVSQRLYKEL